MLILNADQKAINISVFNLTQKYFGSALFHVWLSPGMSIKQENNIDQSILRGESRMIKKTDFKNGYIQQRYKDKYKHLE